MKVDVLMILEAKIEKTFLSKQFCIERFTRPYMLYRNCDGRGTLAYVREDIPSKLIEMNSPVESISVELILRTKKWLVNCSYNASNGNICDHLRSLGKSLDTLLTNYNKVFLMEDFNAEEANIQVPTCFKNPDNSKTIDLMLTNSESAAFKNHVHLKQVFYLTFIK